MAPRIWIQFHTSYKTNLCDGDTAAGIDDRIRKTRRDQADDKKPSYVFLPELYCFCGNFFLESVIVLHKKKCWLVPQNDILNLHSGEYIDVIERLVPDIQMGLDHFFCHPHC